MITEFAATSLLYFSFLLGLFSFRRDDGIRGSGPTRSGPSQILECSIVVSTLLWMFHLVRHRSSVGIRGGRDVSGVERLPQVPEPRLKVFVNNDVKEMKPEEIKKMIPKKIRVRRPSQPDAEMTLAELRTLLEEQMENRKTLKVMDEDEEWVSVSKVIRRWAHLASAVERLGLDASGAHVVFGPNSECQVTDVETGKPISISQEYIAELGSFADMMKKKFRVKEGEGGEEKRMGKDELFAAYYKGTVAVFDAKRRKWAPLNQKLFDLLKSETPVVTIGGIHTEATPDNIERLAKEKRERLAKAAKERKAEEEKRKAEEEQNKTDEEKRKAEEEQNKTDEDKRKAEEERNKTDEAKRKAEEERNKTDEEKKKEEKRKAEEEKKKEEERKAKEAKMKAEGGAEAEGKQALEMEKKAKEGKAAEGDRHKPKPRRDGRRLQPVFPLYEVGRNDPLPREDIGRCRLDPPDPKDDPRNQPKPYDDYRQLYLYPVHELSDDGTGYGQWPKSSNPNPFDAAEFYRKAGFKPSLSDPPPPDPRNQPKPYNDYRHVYLYPVHELSDDGTGYGQWPKSSNPDPFDAAEFYRKAGFKPSLSEYPPPDPEDDPRNQPKPYNDYRQVNLYPLYELSDDGTGYGQWPKSSNPNPFDAVEFYRQAGFKPSLPPRKGEKKDSNKSATGKGTTKQQERADLSKYPPPPPYHDPRRTRSYPAEPGA